jgi:predicted ATPase
MLRHVAQFVPENPILVVGAYRDSEVDRRHPLATALASISRLANFETISLSGLKTNDLADLLETIGDHNAPDELIKAIGDATDGNPLFIRELLLHLVEGGKILHDSQSWISRVSIEELEIPEGIRQVIGRRLQRLSETANQLLTIASAFKGAFALV